MWEREGDEEKKGARVMDGGDKDAEKLTARHKKKGGGEGKLQGKGH